MSDENRRAAAILAPLHDVESEIDRLIKNLCHDESKPVQHARLSNLVIVSNKADQADQVSSLIPAIVGIHPARVIHLVALPGEPPGSLRSSVFVWTQTPRPDCDVFAEKITVQVTGPADDHLPYAVRQLVVGDLPINLWWAVAQPPPLAGKLLPDLAESVQQVIYDSLGWADPHRGMAGASTWLNNFERPPGQSRWRVASDLNWRRLRYWRRLLSQALDPATAPGALDSITEVTVEHGPHAVTQAWLFVGWLASRLGWKVSAARLQLGVEITWQVKSHSGAALRVCIRRLPEGPPEILRVHLSSSINGNLSGVNFVAEQGGRLAAMPENRSSSARTVMVGAQPIAEMVGRQLSDREPDSVFRESLAVAQVFARSVAH
jgi:glucose-6-phosphate dehydrogenase assembly protein OpcA